MGPQLLAQSGFADNMDSAMQSDHVGEFMEVSQRVFGDMTGMRFGPASDIGYFPGFSTEAAREGVRKYFAHGAVHFGPDHGLDLDASRVDRCGTIITGIPLGSAAFQGAAVQRVVDKALAAVETLRHNKSANLICFTKILLECIISRLSFVGQAISPTITGPMFAQFDRRISSAFFATMDMSPMAAQVQQAQLPRSLGGVGLRRMELACVPAYIMTQIKGGSRRSSV
jgi:hypothetical protein